MNLYGGTFAEVKRLQSNDEVKRMNANRVLVVDDDPSALNALVDLLSNAGYQVAKAESGKNALTILRSQPVDIVLLDLRLRDESGFNLIPQLKRICPEMTVIMISAVTTEENTMEALRLGAFDFLPKSIDPSHLLDIVANATKSEP